MTHASCPELMSSILVAVKSDIDVPFPDAANTGASVPVTDILCLSCFLSFLVVNGYW
jgi:exosome complex RNA-binding protein Rrp42 (RNase PH superfamily)